MLSDMDTLPQVELGDYTLKFELDELSPKMQEVARKELRETPERQKEAVEALRDLLKGMCMICSKVFFPRLITPIILHNFTY